MGQIITVWGSPNSGKTTMAIKMAKQLSLDYNVVVLSTNQMTSSLGYLFPFDKNEDKSLGKVLESVILTREVILENIKTTRRNKNIGVLGYQKGENCKDYAEYSEDRAVDLIINLSHIADYVIVDASSEIMNDNLTLAALRISDRVIRLCGTDLKSLVYFKSALKLISDRDYNMKNHIPVISKLYDHDPIDIVNCHYKDAEYTLIYSAEIAKQFDEGRVLDTSKERNKYIEVIDKIIDKLLGKTDVNKKSVFKHFKSIFKIEKRDQNGLQCKKIH